MAQHLKQARQQQQVQQLPPALHGGTALPQAQITEIPAGAAQEEEEAEEVGDDGSCYATPLSATPMSALASAPAPVHASPVVCAVAAAAVEEC